MFVLLLNNNGVWDNILSNISDYIHYLILPLNKWQKLQAADLWYKKNKNTFLLPTFITFWVC